MSLPPNLKPFIVAGSHDAPHTLDIFMDFICPYSKKMATMIDKFLIPALAPGGQYNGKVKIILRLQIQPWHASGTFLHEAALAVAEVAPGKLWAYSLALWRDQEAYMDENALVLTPLDIRKKLVALAAEVIGHNQADRVRGLLQPRPHKQRNGGVHTSEEIRYFVRFGRQNGIHVSPTTMWDGLIPSESDAPQSSWDKEQWIKFLEKHIMV